MALKTNCNLKIPNKYLHMIEEVDYEGKESGYWVYLKEGYQAEKGYGSRTIHEYTQVETLKAIRDIREK